jgi:hypothetical protein
MRAGNKPDDPCLNYQAVIYIIRVVNQGAKGPVWMEGKMDTKNSGKRYGVEAIERGFITLDQLLMAINIQILENLEKGEHRRIGRILAELEIISPSRIMMPGAVEEATGESIRKRFGAIAIEKGFISTEQLISAIEEQIRDEVVKKRHRLIGEILCEKGYMSAEQRDEVLTELGKPESKP